MVLIVLISKDKETRKRAYYIWFSKERLRSKLQILFEIDFFIEKVALTNSNEKKFIFHHLYCDETVKMLFDFATAASLFLERSERRA